eukprot:scaffold32972_cov28-Tisochrysis_lutea.AAC.14
MGSIAETFCCSKARDTCGLGVLNWAFGAIRDVACCHACTRSPASPDAGSPCAPAALKLPTYKGSTAERSANTDSVKVLTSMGSPNGVPVPCAS